MIIVAYFFIGLFAIVSIGVTVMSVFKKDTADEEELHS